MQKLEGGAGVLDEWGRPAAMKSQRDSSLWFDSRFVFVWNINWLLEARMVRIFALFQIDAILKNKSRAL